MWVYNINNTSYLLNKNVYCKYTQKIASSSADLSCIIRCWIEVAEYVDSCWNWVHIDRDNWWRRWSDDGWGQRVEVVDNPKQSTQTTANQQTKWAK